MKLFPLGLLSNWRTRSKNKRLSRTKRKARRRIGEQLESRHLLAADIAFSEILFEPIAFTDFDDQYFEVHGPANETLPQGTYMVVVDGDSQNNRTGEVNARFDLSGLTLGQNGYLVIAQGPNAFTPDPQSTFLQGTDEFAGLPAGIFENDTIISDDFEHIFGSNTFMLIESATEPDIFVDYDANDDGVLDGDAANWFVIDSITINGNHLGGQAADAVYGNVLIREGGNQSTAPQGVETVDVEDAGYIARRDRPGDSVDDLVVGRVDLAADSQNIHLASFPGNEAYRDFVGAKLNHIGGANFFSSVVGSKFDDANNNGEREPNEAGIENLVVYVDVNDNGQLDSFTTTVEPDDFPDSTEVMKVEPGVTISREDEQGQLRSFPPLAVSNPSEATTGTNTFEGTSTLLRLDFLDPVESVSLDASNIGSQLSAIAEMKAFDANGNELATDTTQSLVDAAETMTITRQSADIAVVKAYFTPTPSFNLFDNLSFTRPEPSTTTAPNGDFQIDEIDLHIGGSLTTTLRTVGEAGGETLVLDKAKAFDFTPQVNNSVPSHDDIIGRTDGGEWWIARSNGTRFNTEFFGSWSGSVTWDNAITGDFDGDDVLDVAGRVGREWWVSLTSDQQLTSGQFWGVWPAAANWTDVQVADVNGDGLNDIIGRNDGGAWWVARSTGTSFVMEQWSHWSTNITWDNTVTGDFNGDGRTDLAGRTSGTWFVDLSDGQQFNFDQWGAWSNAVTWEDVLVADYDGDGDDDIAGRTGGNWWIATSTGQAFQNQHWGRWSNAVTWEDVVTGDFDGDGNDDIAGRALGNWWIANSTGSTFGMEFWGRWSNAVTWEDVLVADFNSDGNDDIAGRADGNWWVSRSTGNFFTIEFWDRWSTQVNWNDVQSGTFTPSDVGGSSFGQLSFTDTDSSSLFSSPFENDSDDEVTVQQVVINNQPASSQQRVRRRSRLE